MARVHVVSVSFVVGLVFGLMADTPSALQDSSPKRHIKSADLREGAPYSSAVHVGDTLYLSGRTGADRRTRQVPESLAREVRNILDGMQRTLADAGMTMDDLVSVQVYCPDVSLYDQFNDVYVTYFEGELPARAFLGSGPLLNGANFEIQGIAVKGS